MNLRVKQKIDYALLNKRIMPKKDQGGGNMEKVRNCWMGKYARKKMQENAKQSRLKAWTSMCCKKGWRK